MFCNDRMSASIEVRKEVESDEIDMAPRRAHQKITLMASQNDDGATGDQWNVKFAGTS